MANATFDGSGGGSSDTTASDLGWSLPDDLTSSDGGSSSTNDDPTSGGSSSSGSTSFDTSTQTLGSTALGAGGSGATDDSGDVSVTVDDSNNDPTDSSPAGGAGAEEAVERFAGLEDEALSDKSEETILEVGQAASDAMTEARRNARENVPASASGLPVSPVAVAVAVVGLLVVIIGGGS